ncbi:MAG TPA: FAD-binding oxidoreductase [Thermoanaerobaculia bacterium]|nr:FAD-binding oxidoreductase [Thermoanaerobaculia bacterium]
MAERDLASAVAELLKTFSGQLLRPGDPGYDEARRVHNGLVNRKPALIARCRGVADIVDAVKLARGRRLEIAVKGGGHNVAGRATVDGGLMIDLSLMKGVHVDPGKWTARAQGGVTWAEFNRETQLRGLASTGGVVSSTGVAGLTLGGGLGWLMGKYGLAVDNLLSADIVTADGNILTASAEENPDLFWGIRGGGGNFGVAASFEFRLHQVGPTVTGGMVAHPFAAARDVLRFYRDRTASLPDEAILFGGLIHAPDGSGTKLAAIVLCHCGPLSDGEKLAREIQGFGTPAMAAMGPMPYKEVNAMLDAAYPKGALNYWKSSFLASLSDEAIDTLIGSFERCPTPMGQIILEHFHGAVTRVAPTATAFPHRAPGYDMLILSEWMDLADSDRSIAWARETYGAMNAFLAPGRYVNYLDDEEPGDPVAAAYGPNFKRLRELKKKYDPENVFHRNQNIRPA